MVTHITYTAFDGKTFSNADDCLAYERKQKEIKRTAILQEMIDLELQLWKKFHPDYVEDGNNPTLLTASIWLKSDIQSIMIEFPNSEKDIISFIKEYKYGEDILNEYIDMEDVRENVKIRSDFLTAFSSVREGSDLAHKLNYCLSSSDLEKLAILHKSNKCKKKIENLLESINFHKECSDFKNERYEEYIK